MAMTRCSLDESLLLKAESFLHSFFFLVSVRMQELKSTSWASLSRRLLMQPVLRYVWCGNLLWSKALPLFDSRRVIFCVFVAEGEGVHWKTQHDFSSGKISRKFIFFCCCLVCVCSLFINFRCSSDMINSF